MKPKPVFETIKTILGHGFAAEPLPRPLVCRFVRADEVSKFTKKCLYQVFGIRAYGLEKF